MEALSSTFYATSFTFLMTTLGAAAVLISKKKPSPLFTKLSLGFAAGIMIAASVWSLLMPAIDQLESEGKTAAFPVATGFILGAAFLMILDKLMPHLHINSQEPEGPKTTFGKHQLLFLAMTIHNIPEGMAVGISFVAAAAINTPEAYSAAIALTIGMGIQNVPEGTAVTLPLRASGMSSGKSFIFGVISGLVEPIAALIVVMLSTLFIPIMPWLLSFAAGAMIYVVIEELIPTARLGEHSDIGTIAVILGFVLMMVLDTSLG